MSTHPILDSRYSWIRLCLTMIAALVANVGIWMIIAVLPDIEREFGASRAWATVPYTTTMIGFAVGNYIAGRLVDAFGVSRSLQAAALLTSAAFAGSALAPDMVTLSAVHLLLGVGTAIGFGPLIADISHWFFRQRGLAVALVASGNYLSGAFWPIALSNQLATGEWRTVYVILAAATVIVLIPISFTLRRQIPMAARAVAENSAAIRSATSGIPTRFIPVLLGLAGIGCCVAMSMPQVHIVAYCVGLGYGPAVGQQMLALMLMGGVVSRIVSGLISDRVGGVLTLLLGSVLQCIALFLYLPWDGMVSLYIISMMFGLSQGGIVPSYAVVVREYMPAKEAGSWVGFVLMMTILGMALGGLMSGWIYDLTQSYQLAFINGILWNGLNIAIVLYFLLNSKRKLKRTTRPDFA